MWLILCDDSVVSCAMIATAMIVKIQERLKADEEYLMDICSVIKKKFLHESYKKR